MENYEYMSSLSDVQPDYDPNLGHLKSSESNQKDETTALEKAEKIDYQKALAIIRESMILQDLENKGVAGVSRVVKNDENIALSTGAYLYDESQKGKLVSSVVIEKVPGLDWGKYNFENLDQLISASIKVSKIFNNIYEAGYSHNDINPSNMMIDQQGNVNVIDFNSASKHDENGYSVGISMTTDYAAPERLEFTDVFHITGDIYSLALTILKKIPEDNTGSEDDSRRKKLTLFLKNNLSENVLLRCQSFNEFADYLDLVMSDNVSYDDFESILKQASDQHKQNYLTYDKPDNPYEYKGEYIVSGNDFRVFEYIPGYVIKIPYDRSKGEPVFRGYKSTSGEFYEAMIEDQQIIKNILGDSLAESYILPPSDLFPSSYRIIQKRYEKEQFLDYIFESKSQEERIAFIKEHRQIFEDLLDKAVRIRNEFGVPLDITPSNLVFADGKLIFIEIDSPTMRKKYEADYGRKIRKDEETLEELAKILDIHE